MAAAPTRGFNGRNCVFWSHDMRNRRDTRNQPAISTLSPLKIFVKSSALCETLEQLGLAPPPAPPGQGWSRPTDQNAS